MSEITGDNSNPDVENAAPFAAMTEKMPTTDHDSEKPASDTKPEVDGESEAPPASVPKPKGKGRKPKVSGAADGNDTPTTPAARKGAKTPKEINLPALSKNDNDLVVAMLLACDKPKLGSEQWNKVAKMINSASGHSAGVRFSLLCTKHKLWSDSKSTTSSVEEGAEANTNLPELSQNNNNVLMAMFLSGDKPKLSSEQWNKVAKMINSASGHSASTRFGSMVAKNNFWSDPTGAGPAVPDTPATELAGALAATSVTTPTPTPKTSAKRPRNKKKEVDAEQDDDGEEGDVEGSVAKKPRKAPAKPRATKAKKAATTKTEDEDDDDVFGGDGPVA